MAKDDRALNFFALVADRQNPVRRIPVTSKLQAEVSDLFLKQRDQFRSGLDEVKFAGSYSPDNSEVLYIEGFELPAELVTVIQSPTDCQNLVLENGARDTIRGLFAGMLSSQQFVCFQAFERRRLISPKGFSLIVSHDTFRRLEEPGLTLDDKLAALYLAGRLYFRSYFQARRVLDLSAYYREATDQELEKFVAHKRIAIDDEAGFRAAADTWVRRKVALIQDSKIIDQEAPRKISLAAKKFGIGLTVSTKGGHERLRLPATRKELKEALRFLDEDYYDSPVTGRRYVSNSKRPVDE